MEVHTFTGYVEKIFEPTQYDVEVAVANYKDEDGKAKMLDDFKNRRSNDYPTALRFKAGIRSGASAQLDDVREGDKIQVQFCISGKSGVSKKTGKYYCINELNICKKEGVKLLLRAERKEEPSQQADASDDVPF